MQNVSVHDIRVRSLDRSRGGTFRYGINANGTRGDNVSFRRIELGEVASRPWDAGDRLLSSFGVYLRDARGVTVEDIQCRGRYGLGLVDSQNITVRGFDARYLDTGSTLRSFGVFTQQNPDGELADITLEAVRVEGYDVGIAYPTEDACAPFTLRELEIVDSQEIAERPAPCPRVP